MNPVQERAYVRLLLHMWKSRDCTLENDSATLANLAHCSRAQWDKNRRVVLGCMLDVATGDPATPATKRFTNARLHREWSALRAADQRRSDAGRAAAQARWSASDSDAMGMPEGMRSACDSHAERNAMGMRIASPTHAGRISRARRNLSLSSKRSSSKEEAYQLEERQEKGSEESVLLKKRETNENENAKKKYQKTDEKLYEQLSEIYNHLSDEHPSNPKPDLAAQMFYSRIETIDEAQAMLAQHREQWQPQWAAGRQPPDLHSWIRDYSPHAKLGPWKGSEPKADRGARIADRLTEGSR